MTDPVAERDAGAMAAARESLGGVTVKGTIHEGDNLAILLASYFEDWADEDEETDENGTWKQSAVFQTEQVLNAIHAHYVTVLLSERQRGREEAADLIETLSPPDGVGLPGADVPQQAPYRRRTDMTKNIVGRLAGRFLTWKLPADFNPDGGVTFTPEYQNPSGPAKHEPTGTNLLTYAQAVTMVEHMLADLIESLSPPDGVGLPFERDTLGRMVREAWVRWAQTQPNPKPSFLAPYDDLSEADKEADRQIGEAIAKWTMIGVSAQANSPAASPPDGVGLTRYDKVGNEYDETTFMAVAPAGEWVRYEDAAAALAAKDAQIALDAETRTKMTLTIHEAWKALGIENYNGSDTRTLPEALTAALAAEKARRDGPEDGGLGDPDDWGADGAKWAAAFHETAIRLGYSDMDEGWLIGWFANAIERGRVAHPDTKRERATIAERDRRIAELEAGLEPFARIVDKDGENIVLKWGQSTYSYVLFPKHFYAARVLLTGQDTGGSDG